MQNRQMSEQIAIATNEGTRKQGKPCKRQREEAAEDLNLIEMKTGSQCSETLGNRGALYLLEA